MPLDLDTLTKLKQWFVTQDEFHPIRLLVYGMAGTILMGFATWLVSLAFK